jgi:serine/threonine protein kinase/WD40 repeat protein
VAAVASSCPDPERLRLLLAGTLTDGEQADVISHLDGCPSCQRDLERLASGEHTWGETARNLGDGPPSDDPALRRVMTGLRHGPGGDSTGAWEPVDEKDVLALLDPPERPGQLGRLDRYEMTAVVGRGGMGVVLKAWDPVLHRTEAVKVLAPQLAASGAARQRFAREAKAAAAVSHEHVAAIRAVGEAKGLPYLVMEYVDGPSLQERLDRSGPLEVKEILRIGMQAADGLAAAHKQGLVHRDIKPANILLHNGLERVKLTDFGLARAADDASLTRSGVLCGTPQYMAPEQARGEAVDHRADLFSLGSVLYAMCSGRPPFRADSAMAVLKRVCDARPRPIREINPDIPPWLAAIIARLHAKDPAGRFQSAAQVADLLGRHLAHLRNPDSAPRPVTPLPPAPPARDWRELWRRRRWTQNVVNVVLPVLAGVLVLVLVLAVRLSKLPIFNRPRTGVSVKLPDPRMQVVLRRQGEDAGTFGEGVWALEPGHYTLQAMLPDPVGGRPRAVDEREFDLSDGEIESIEVPQHGGIHFDVDAGGLDVKILVDGQQVPLGSGGARRSAVSAFRVGPHHIRVLQDGKPVNDETVWFRAGPARVFPIVPVVTPTNTVPLRSAGGPAPHASVYAAALSPDGHTLARVVDSTLLQVFDADTGEERFTRRVASTGLAFSPGGDRLAFYAREGDGSGRAGVYVVDARSGAPELIFVYSEGLNVRPIQFAPDGKSLAAGSAYNHVDGSGGTRWEAGFRAWDMDGKTRAARWLPGHGPGAPKALHVAAGGKLVALGGEDGAGSVWDFTREPAGETPWPGHGRTVEAAAFSPDGKTLAAAESSKENGRVVALYDVPTGKLLATLPGAKDQVGCLAFSRDGKTLATGGVEVPDGGGGVRLVVRLWEVSPRGTTTARLRARLDGADEVLAITFLRDGTLVAAGKGGAVRRWDVKRWVPPAGL